MTYKLILIEIDDGLSLIPCPGLVLQRSKLTKDQCTLFLPGQSPHEGFLIDRAYDEVAEELAGVLEEMSEETSEDMSEESSEHEPEEDHQQ